MYIHSQILLPIYHRFYRLPTFVLLDHQVLGAGLLKPPFSGCATPSTLSCLKDPGASYTCALPATATRTHPLIYFRKQNHTKTLSTWEGTTQLPQIESVIWTLWINEIIWIMKEHSTWSLHAQMTTFQPQGLLNIKKQKAASCPVASF